MSAQDGRVGASVGLDEVKIWRVSEKKGCFAGTLWQYLVIPCTVPSLRLIFFFITPTTLSQARELLEFDISMYPGATVSAPLRPL